MSVQILIGDCRERMKELPDASVDSVVCDPPYHLTSGNVSTDWSSFKTPKGTTNTAGRGHKAKSGFMGQTWDGGDVAFDPATWAEVLRVLKPGGHMVAFSGTRTYHRMVCAIEDAGFEIRDQLAWVYGSGFPKSLDVSKAIDKAAGAERPDAVIGGHIGVSERGGDGKGRNELRASIVHGINKGAQTRGTPASESAKQWQGWGTALKPSWEPICLARKPLIGSVAANVLAHGTGALNIDGCRIGTDEDTARNNTASIGYGGSDVPFSSGGSPLGRWPANLCHDGSDEVLVGFPDQESGANPTRRASGMGYHGAAGQDKCNAPRGADSGSAARFFYTAKATTAERGEGNNHPTVKPVALMRWLCRLVTPKGGTILDPFMGSGSTGLAADAEQFNFIGCELSAEYAEIARKRIADQAGMFADIEMVHSVDARAA